MSSFASRAGEKLQFALDTFKFSVKDLTVADFGSSTGGFVDCLLRNGANKVYSVDTSYGELAWKLRNDPKVVVLERTNAMHVQLPEKMDLITIDTAWTKQEKVLPNALNNLKTDGKIIALIKPHYEADKKFLDHGKLREENIEEALAIVIQGIKNCGGEVLEIVQSPILGKRVENKEFLALIAQGASI